MNKLTIKESFRLLYKILSFTVIIFLIGIMLAMTSCSTANHMVHEINETPTSTRQALVYDDHVIIITRTKLTVDQFDKLLAKTLDTRAKK